MLASTMSILKNILSIIHEQIIRLTPNQLIDSSLSDLIKTIETIESQAIGKIYEMYSKK